MGLITAVIGVIVSSAFTLTDLGPDFTLDEIQASMQIVIGILLFIGAYAVTGLMEANSTLRHVWTEIEDVRGALRPLELRINLDGLHDMLEIFVDQVNSQVARGAGRSDPQILKATRMLAHATSVVRYGSYHRINDVHLLREFFAEAEEYAIAISTAELMGLLAPPYFLYLTEHGLCAPHLTRIGIGDSDFAQANRLDELLANGSFLAARLYCYPREEYVQNRETFEPLITLGERLRISTVALVYEKLLKDQAFTSLLLDIDRIIQGEVVGEDGEANFVYGTRSGRMTSPLPDFLLTDKAAIFVMYHKRTEDPRHFKICRDRDPAKHDTFKHLVDHLIAGIKNDSFA